MEIKIGTQKAQIITDNPEILSTLYERFSFRVKGAEFSPAYRARRWDGKKHFITRNGVFRSGLLERVLAILTEAGVKPSVTGMDHLPCPHSKERKLLRGLSYYDYQWEAIQDAQTHLRMVVQSPTGSGKTIVMAGIWLNLNCPKSLFIFNKKQLTSQTYEFFKAHGLNSVGICTGEGYEYGDTMFCTVQSIDKVLDTHGDCEAIFVDECHEFCHGETTLAAIQAFPNATYRFGFTATPPKEKNDSVGLFNLEGALGPIKIYKTTAELVDEGKLSKPIVQLLQLPKDKTIDDENMSYQEIYKECIVNNEYRNQQIKLITEKIRTDHFVSLTMEYSTPPPPPRILIIVESLDHLNTFEGINGFYTLEGVDDLATRYKVIHDFLNHPTSSCLVGTKIMQTGINIQEISHFINARGLKSETATLQALGRTLRKQEGQEKVFVYDFLDPYRYLKAHSDQRKSAYEAEGHEVKILNEN